MLGKTAYYDPQSHEVHIYTDGRHPKDMLRSIAHELIHHKQNLEGRLQVGGYNGPGYYLENDKLKEVEHEAMLEGNAFASSKPIPWACVPRGKIQDPTPSTSRKSGGR